MHNLHYVATHLHMCCLDLPDSPSHESPPAKRRKYDRSDGMYICIIYTCIVRVLHYLITFIYKIYKKSNLRKGSRDHNKK